MSISVVDSFQLLEIQPTKEITKIKKAYAEKTKKFHPETHPDEWRKIHDAYKRALSYAKKSDTVYIVKQNDPVYTEDNDSDELEYGSLFEKMDAICESDLNEQKKELMELLKNMKRKWPLVLKKDWLILFSSPTWDHCKSDKEIIEIFLKLIRRNNYFFTSFEILYNELWELYEYYIGLEEYDFGNRIRRSILMMEKNWEYDEYAKKWMQSYWKKYLWIIWENYCHIPFLFKLLVVFVMYQVAIVVHMLVNKGFDFSYINLAVFIFIIWEGCYVKGSHS